LCSVGLHPDSQVDHNEILDQAIVSQGLDRASVFFQRMSLKAAANFCRRLGVGLRAGADLIPLLHNEGKSGPARQRDAINALAEGARQGEQLSSIMQRRKDFFPALLISMTRVGEATGRLERALLNLADHYDQRIKLRRAFMQSIAWPAIQLFGGIVVVSLLIWIMGILTPAGGGEMTDLLGFGLRGERGVLVFWGYLALFFGIIAALYWGFSRNIGGSQNLIRLFYLIPKLGSAVQTITLSRFAWTLALALDAGLDPIRSIALALDSTDSDYYRAGTQPSEDAIRSGETLAGALKSTDIFPDEFLLLVETAELSGTDSESIERLARDYDERAQLAMKTISGIATGVIWISVMGFLLFMIFRILMTISGFYSEALGGN
jgi:type II secretory pathway component PulF